MPLSRRRKDERRCPCGLAHVVLIFNRASYDELELPVEVHAFASCIEWGDWVDNLPPGYGETYFAEIMSTHVAHFPNWLARHKERTTEKPDQP